jgi:hypothetical protein
MLRVHPVREPVSLHAASLADPRVRRADQILPPPRRLLDDDRFSVFLGDLAQPDTEETSLRPIHEHDPGGAVLVEKPEELLERRRAPVKLIVDRDL